MEELKVEQAEINEQSKQELAQAEGQAVQTETVSYGKFKDAQALLNAYNSLQAEFTKRCQRVKELEGKLSTVEKTEVPTQLEENKEHREEQNKDDILKEYLKSILSGKQRAIVLDGTGMGVKTPVERPKTIEQAGKLAKELLSK